MVGYFKMSITVERDMCSQIQADQGEAFVLSLFSVAVIKH